MRRRSVSSPSLWSSLRPSVTVRVVPVRGSPLEPDRTAHPSLSSCQRLSLRRRRRSRRNKRVHVHPKLYKIQCHLLEISPGFSIHPIQPVYPPIYFGGAVVIHSVISDTHARR